MEKNKSSPQFAHKAGGKDSTRLGSRHQAHGASQPARPAPRSPGSASARAWLTHPVQGLNPARVRRQTCSFWHCCAIAPERQEIFHSNSAHGTDLPRAGHLQVPQPAAPWGFPPERPVDKQAMPEDVLIATISPQHSMVEGAEEVPCAL